MAAQLRLQIQTEEDVDSTASLISMLNNFHDMTPYPPSLFVDKESHDRQDRGTTISTLLLLATSNTTLYRVDLLKLGESAFSVKSTIGSGRSLKDFLESDTIFKVTFDIRDLSPVLFSKYKIWLKGFEDIQLMELASCLDKDTWKKYFTGFEHLVRTELGPELCSKIKDGWTERVESFPALWKIYREKLRASKKIGVFWLVAARNEASKRVKAANTGRNDPAADNYNKGPSAWYGGGLDDWKWAWFEDCMQEESSSRVLDPDGFWH
jgi:hypothetical protein